MATILRSRRVSTILSRPKATRLIKVENLFRASTDVTLSTGMRTSNQGAQARIYAGAQSADLLKCTLEQVRHCCLRQPDLQYAAVIRTACSCTSCPVVLLCC